MMKKSIFVIFILLVMIACSPMRIHANNQYLELVNNYDSAQELAIKKIPLQDSQCFYLNKDKFSIDFSDTCGVKIYITDFEGRLINEFQLGYNFSAYYLKGIYKTKIEDKDVLIITHYLPGSSGWSANVVFLHILTKIKKSYHYQELSTFFSGIDSIVDLDHDGSPEFICLNLVLDSEGQFIVPIVFSLDKNGFFTKKMTNFLSVPALIDRHKGLVRTCWDSVPESVIKALDMSIPVVVPVP